MSLSRILSMNGIKEPLIVTLKSLDIQKPATLAANNLLKGGIIATPTDTIYGIAALANDIEAIRKVYEIKGRNFSKPLSICVGEIKDLNKWGHVNITEELLHQLLPGPVTLCFTRRDTLNCELNPGSELVGIRIPDHEFIREVCRLTDLPLALTSANVSSAQSTLSVDEFKELHGKLNGIFDGGTLGVTKQSRLGSTIIDLSKSGHFKIIRQGCAEQETVKKLTRFGLKKQNDDIEN